MPLTPDNVRQFKERMGFDVIPPLESLLKTWSLLHNYRPEGGLFKVALAEDARTWMIGQYEEMINNVLAFRYSRYRLEDISNIGTDVGLSEPADIEG